jgi:signal transduction histidine kinase
MNRLFEPTAVVAGIAFGAFTTVIARRDPAYSFLAGGSSPDAAATLVAGYALIGCGLVSRRRRPQSRFWPLITIAGFAWFVLEWNTPGADSAFVFTAGLVLYLAAPPLIAHAMFLYPHGRPALASRAAVALAYLGAILVLGVLPTLVYDPRAAACTECPQNLLLLHRSPRIYDDLGRAGVYLGVAWSCALVAGTGWRLIRGTPALRRSATPVLLSGAAYLALVGAEFVHSIDRGFVSNTALDRDLWRAQAAAVIALVLGVVWNWIRVSRARTAVARFVLARPTSPPAGELEQTLSRILNDRTLRLLYLLTNGTLVDTEGHEHARPASATPLLRDGQLVALLEHAPVALADPGLIEEVAGAARLAIDHDRLLAQTRAQLDELRASRARAVALTDEERRRLERDLHDGAQQRLVRLLLSLRLARFELDAADDPSLGPRLDEVEAEIQACVTDLRQLAHGIYPAVLSDEGLSAAVDALADEADVPVQVATLPDQRLQPPVEAAAYFVIAEAVKHAKQGTLVISTICDDGRVIVQLEGDDIPRDVTELRDRVGALGGTLDVMQQPGAPTKLRADIPCEF